MAKIKEYVRDWEPFQEIWEVDKDEFLKKYEESNPTVEMFDADIGK